METRTNYKQPGWLRQHWEDVGLIIVVVICGVLLGYLGTQS